MDDPTKMLVDHGRVIAARLAGWIDKISGGRISAAHITTTSLLGHIPAAWALYVGRPILAAILITVFGLMDALDGAMARHQNKASATGMFFDAVTDRMKEILLYSGLAVYVATEFPQIPAWTVAAVAGTSLLVSYVKAKGEMAVTKSSHSKQELNRVFSGGIARYEIRMAILVLALVSGYIEPALRLVIALNLATASIRFMDVAKLLSQEDHKKNAKN